MTDAADCAALKCHNRDRLSAGLGNPDRSHRHGGSTRVMPETEVTRLSSPWDQWSWRVALGAVHSRKVNEKRYSLKMQTVAKSLLVAFRAMSPALAGL